MCSPLCTAESRRRRPAAEAVPGSLAEVVLPVAMRLAGGLPREEARTRERRVAPQRAVEQQEAQARRCLAEEPPLVALGFKNWSLLTQWRQISGLTPTQQNIFYQFADWTIVE